MSTSARLLKTGALLGGVAIALNYPWEMLQESLYTLPFSGALHWRLCFRASLGDAGLVLLLFALWSAARRRLDWGLTRADLQDLPGIAAAGAILGAGVEWLSVHAWHHWGYRERMPLIPVLEIALVPVVQMSLLTTAIFWLAAAWLLGVAPTQSGAVSKQRSVE